MKYFLHALKNTFNYEGRVSRAEFLWFYIASFVIYTLLFSILCLLFVYYRAGVPIDLIQPEISITITNYIIKGFLGWFLIATLSLITRRLHDIGKSGWWLVLGVLPVFLFLFIAITHLINDVYYDDIPSIEITIIFWLMMLYLVFIVIAHFWLLFKKGEPTKNQYGEAPKTLK